MPLVFVYLAVLSGKMNGAAAQNAARFYSATKILQTSGTTRLLHGLSALLSRFS
jgi:hypothetical protein